MAYYYFYIKTCSFALNCLFSRIVQLFEHPANDIIFSVNVDILLIILFYVTNISHLFEFLLIVHGTV